MSVSPSASVAVTTAPTSRAAASVASPTVSVKLRDVVLLEKAGALLEAEPVVPLPEADHAPSPSAFTARTCTW